MLGNDSHWICSTSSIEQGFALEEVTPPTLAKAKQKATNACNSTSWEAVQYSHQNGLQLIRSTCGHANAKENACTNLPGLNGGDWQCFGSETLSGSPVFRSSQGQILLQLHLLDTMEVNHDCLP